MLIIYNVLFSEQRKVYKSLCVLFPALDVRWPDVSILLYDPDVKISQFSDLYTWISIFTGIGDFIFMIRYAIFFFSRFVDPDICVFKFYL